MQAQKLTLGDCKCCIKSIDRHNVLIVGTKIDIILCFVRKKSHGFSFVLWATIGLTRKIFPNVNQFFESLYCLNDLCFVQELCKNFSGMVPVYCLNTL